MDGLEQSSTRHSTHGPERASTCSTLPRIANVSASQSSPQQQMDAQVVGGSSLANIFHDERASSRGHSPGETHSQVKQHKLAEKSEDTSEDESGQCTLQLRAVQVRNCSGYEAKKAESQDSTHQHNDNDMHTTLGQRCIRRAMLPVDGSVELLEFHYLKLALECCTLLLRLACSALCGVCDDALASIPGSVPEGGRAAYGASAVKHRTGSRALLSTPSFNKS